ncbi:MAG: acyl-ACP--UDP-N-acetylglucosamine O-acyltransferase [Kiritimatiellia bacterium]
MSNTEIHPTAVIEPGAELGAGVKVGPFAYIRDKVKIGAGTEVGPHAVIHSFTEIGENCRIHAGAVLGDLPQDLGFKGAESYVRIGNGCIIREGVTVHRGTMPGSATVMGDECFLMAYSHLAHNVKLGNKVILANSVLLAGHVEVGNNVFVGGGAAIHQFCKVGRLAMVGGLSAVSKDIPPFCTHASGAFNSIAGLNVVGLRRNGFDGAARMEIRQAFKMLFASGLNVSQAVNKMRETFKSAAVREMCDFIEASKRGICAFRGASGDEEAG